MPQTPNLVTKSGYSGLIPTGNTSSLFGMNTSPNITGINTSGTGGLQIQSSPVKPAAPLTIQSSPIKPSAPLVIGGTSAAPAAPKPATPAPVNPNQNQINSIQQQIAQITGQINAAQNAGYSGNQQIKYNPQGQIIPASQANNQPIPPSTPNPTPNPEQATGFSSAVGALQNFNPTQSPQYQQAYTDYQSAVKNLADFKSQLAQQYGNIETEGIPLEFMQGREQVIGRQASAQLDALQNAVVQAQQGIGFALQGGQQQLGALETAGGLTAPQPYGITQTPFFPTGGGPTGQFGTMAGGTGGAFGAGIIQGQIGLGQQSAQNQAILGKVQAQLPSFDSLVQQAGINPSDTTFINAISNWGKTNLFSDARVPEFQGQLNDIIASLSQVLGVPSSATSDFRTGLAGAIVNALQKGSSVSQALNYAVQQAMTASRGYATGAQGANPSGTPTGSLQDGQTSSDGTLIYKNGSWQPNR
jgi:hypothetical protein